MYCHTGRCFQWDRLEIDVELWSVGLLKNESVLGVTIPRVHDISDTLIAPYSTL
jgi:hypothetical protein